ncbi:VOC family protein [Luteimonas marina]|uniref:VOC family protein n=1 Tax=Luteimonas marina TaxID=488485 RepID=A0A5C5UCA9_9GAMM|nr:VOC family protein [Luteimonas marina]TWT23548.1 VOC family protein [Luteimonas marina]
MNPYLSFPNGDCKAAFDFYQRALGADCLFSHTWAESPMVDEAPGGDGSKIMHATLRFPDGSILMGADCPPEHAAPFGGFSLSINTQDVAEAERLFAGISEGGKVAMPLEKTFWAERFGMCTDRFGVSWMVNCEMRAPET